MEPLSAQEDGLDVATLIKQTQMLRHRKHKKFDSVKDFRFPSAEEIAKTRGGSTKYVLGSSSCSKSVRITWIRLFF